MSIVSIIASTRTEPPIVVCGNGTLRAALSLGWEWIACELKPLSKAQENQLAMIDNLTGAEPDWIDEAVAEMMREVDTANDAVLDKMLADLAKDVGIVPGDSEGEQPAGVQSIPEAFRILIECKDEAQQAELLERFAAEGLECRSLIA